MGYTSFTKDLVKRVVDEYKPKTIADYGSQNDFSGPNLPAPYISRWFIEELGIKEQDYDCFDLNGENNAYAVDLSSDQNFPWEDNDGNPSPYCLVCDIGTIEHLGKNGAFSWEAIYNGWKNKFNMCKEGGVIVSENPLSGFWPGHGWNYHTPEFYMELEKVSDLQLLKWGTVCATGNCETGQNVWSIMRRIGNHFPSLEIFKELSIKQS